MKLERLLVVEVLRQAFERCWLPFRFSESEDDIGINVNWSGTKHENWFSILCGISTQSWCEGHILFSCIVFHHFSKGVLLGFVKVTRSRHCTMLQDFLFLFLDSLISHPAYHGMPIIIGFPEWRKEVVQRVCVVIHLGLYHEQACIKMLTNHLVLS